MQNMISISNDSSEVSKIEATIQNDNLTIQEQIRTLQQTIKKLKNDMYNSNKNESINYGGDNNKCNSNNEDKFKFSFNDAKGKCEEKGKDKEKAAVYNNSNNKRHFYQENMNKIRKEKQLLAEMTQFKRDLNTNKDNSYFKRKLIENEDNNNNYNNNNINNDIKTITSNSNYNTINNNINIINSPTNSVPFSLESITNSDEIETLLSLHRSTPKQIHNITPPITNLQSSIHNNNSKVNPNLISNNQNPMLFIEDLSHTIKESKSSTIRSYRTSSIPNKHTTRNANISTYKANVVSSEISTNRNVHKRNKSFMFKTNNTSNSSIRINNNISPFKIKHNNHNISSYNSKYNYNKTVQTYLNEISKLKSEVSKLQKENALLKEELLSEQTQHSHYRQLTEDMINYYNTTKLKKQKHFYSK
jgi:hypothetical protein